MLQVRKHINRETVHKSYYTPSDSAVWKIKELPGLLVGRVSNRPPLGQGWCPARMWKIYRAGLEESDLSLQVYQALKDQEFPTRREALQAVEAAWFSMD